jgi:hypothetical protein
MSDSPVVRFYRFGFALLTLAAIAYQYSVGERRVDFVPANFFSFFTIQSNLIAAGVFLYLAVRPQTDDESSEGMDLLRGAAVAFMTTTYIVYGLLLSGYEDALQTSEPWVNTVLHKLFPIVVVIDWLIDRPSARVPFRRALVWAVYPVLYLVYSLIRGPRVDWYPYPFLDPNLAGGYAGVAATSAGIAIGFVIIAWLIVTLGRRVRIRFEEI